MTEQEQITRRLDILIRLVGLTVGSNLPTSERAPLLSRAGVDRTTIAAICGTTKAAVSVRLTEAKKRTKEGRTKR